MIDLEFLQRLIRSVDESGIDSVEIERGGTRIRIAKSPAPAGHGAAAAEPAAPAGAGGPAPNPHAPPSPPPAATSAPTTPEPAAGSEEGDAPDTGDLVDVTSPMVGTFYRAPSPGADPFTEVGDRISRGETLCIIEAMKLMNELEAEVDGVVREVCVENGEPVEYGQVLFRVEPD